MEKGHLVTRTELIKNYDEIPVGPGTRYEGAFNYTEFPTADYKPRKQPIGKKIQKEMTGFMARTKKFWASLLSRKRVAKKPEMKSTTGALPTKKPRYYGKALKNRTHFNKTKKYDHFKDSLVKEKAPREKIYVKDLPPAITISKTQLKKNYDEIPVGAHVHFEGAPVFGEFPAADFKKKTIPLSKQIKKNYSRFMTRARKWYSGLSKRRIVRKPGVKRPIVNLAKLKAKRTHFDKTKKYDAFRNSLVLEKAPREKVYVKDLPPAKIISKSELINNYDEIPVGAHIHFEGAPAFSEFPGASFKPKSKMTTKKIQRDVNSFMARAGKYWRSLLKRRIITKGVKKGGVRRPMWGRRMAKYRTKFDKTKRYDHFKDSLVKEKPMKKVQQFGEFHGTDIKHTHIITRSELLKNYDEIPVGPHVHFEDEPLITEFPIEAVKPKTKSAKSVSKKITKDVNNFFARSKKYWRGLQSRRIMKKGQLAMKSGMKKMGFKMTKRTKFDKTKKFDHWSHALVVAKAPKGGVLPPQQAPVTLGTEDLSPSKLRAREEEQKQNALKAGLKKTQH